MHAQLGDIVFEGLVGFQSFSGNSEENYAEHATILNKPRLQKLGSKLDTRELSIRFHISFCDPELELNKLMEAKKKGQILPFTLGNGRYLGDFVIQKMGEDIQQLTVGAAIHEVIVSISLLEYFTPDKESSAANQAASNGFANAQNDPPLTTPQPIPLAPSQV